MYERFGLVLMVTRTCNLRCAYCYVGAKSGETMDLSLGRAAIDRAVRSLAPGGTLELGFLGGEPLLVADRIAELIDHARAATRQAGLRLAISMTTNGTVADEPAWRVMTALDVQLTVSHDGLPEVHDRYRRAADGRGTSAQVTDTLARLLAAGVDVQVAMVVRPNNVARLPEGIVWLRRRGVRHVVPSLDLWAQWDPPAARELEAAIARAADLWHEGLPTCSISWFDEKAARLAGVGATATARCGFGDGEVAVSPSGRLYPCERLIGDDGLDNPMRLPGHVLEGDDFLHLPKPAAVGSGCSSCGIHADCNTFCRCGNYVRTGDVSRPDGLLCLWNKACHDQTARILRKMSCPCASSLSVFSSLS
ncbi:MAG: radical SAM protein [Pirellulales bacterium]|nr:radical SAM protein [Pirellulales bacterium]